MARELITREDGEQVVVETGRGRIDTVEHGEGKRNARVSITATHTNLREPVTGWIDTNDLVAWSFAQKAHRDGDEVTYRIEVHRLAAVDKATPIAELTSRQKVRDLVSLTPTSLEVDTAPPPAPPAEPAPPPPDPEPAPPEAPADTAPPPTNERPSRSRPRIAEARPWETVNSDGSPNVGAYAVTGTLEVLEMALEIILLAEVEPTPTLVETIGRSLLRVVDAVQSEVRPDGHVDRNAPSHYAARHALRAALRIAAPPAKTASADQLGRWEDRAIRTGRTLYRLAVDLSGVDYRSPEEGNR